MPMDFAGAAIIGGGVSMLFMRIIVACVKTYQIREAKMMHFSEQARAKHSLIPRAMGVIESIPRRLRFGLALGACSTLFGLGPVALQWLVSREANATAAATADSGESNAMARACWVAGKWLVIGSIITTARRHVMRKLRAWRAEKNS